MLILNLITWLKQCLSALPTRKWLFIPFALLTFVRRPLWAAHTSERGVTLPFQSGASTQLICTFTWKICLFSPLFLFNHLSVSVWTHGYLFYTLGYNPILLYFLLQLFQLWLVALSVDSCAPLQCGFGFTYFSQHFLTLGHYKVHKLILYHFLLQSWISHFSNFIVIFTVNFVLSTILHSINKHEVPVFFCLQQRKDEQQTQ